MRYRFTLKQKLIQFDFSSHKEIFLVENQRFYEILLVSTANNSDSKINPIGSLIWQSNTPEQAKITTDYLKKTLDHYKRVQLSRNTDVQHIIDAYSTIAI